MVENNTTAEVADWKTRDRNLRCTTGRTRPTVYIIEEMSVRAKGKYTKKARILGFLVIDSLLVYCFEA